MSEMDEGDMPARDMEGEDALDMACEMVCACMALAAEDGCDPGAMMAGMSVGMSEDGESMTLKAGSYSGTFSVDDIEAVMIADEEHAK